MGRDLVTVHQGHYHTHLLQRPTSIMIPYELEVPRRLFTDFLAARKMKAKCRMKAKTPPPLRKFLGKEFDSP
jgi:hypothetical protein